MTNIDQSSGVSRYSRRIPIEDLDGSELGYRPDRVDLLVYDEEIDSMIKQVGLGWCICVDGSSNINGSGAGIVIYTPEGGQIEQSLKFAFQASNNEAEYEAVIAGLKMAQVLGRTEYKIISDSKLVIGQITREIDARDESMKKYLKTVKQILSKTSKQQIIIEHQTRDGNLQADALVALASPLSGLKRRII